MVGRKEARIKRKVKAIPESCGVYIFKDRRGRILYIGKAKSLKKRVKSYFTRDLSSKTQVLVSKTAGIEYRVTRSEHQARMLEASLVRELQPHYNIDLKDDKSFPVVRFSGEKFPLVSICRTHSLKGAQGEVYLGPFTDAKALRSTLKAMRRVFGFRSCKSLPKKPCLYYRLKLCPAPCIGKISAMAYGETMKQIQLFLESKYEDLIDRLSARMQRAARAHRFEEAGRIRDQIRTLSVAGETGGKFWRQTKGVRSGCRTEVEDLKRLLRLKRLPLRIEAFDISNISGKEACGSMVSFYLGSPDKDNYRRFRIKTVHSVDDYAMLREVIFRRYFRVARERLILADLALIDGGRAHLLTAAGQIKGLGLKIPVASIAKEKENIYILAKSTPIRLKNDTPALNLIRRIRDEAHRFAIKYHHLLRRKKLIGK
ncbi:GIY-YIG nuclease family protein [Candidatus Omnitrophota bacterium]